MNNEKSLTVVKGAYYASKSLVLLFVMALSTVFDEQCCTLHNKNSWKRCSKASVLTPDTELCKALLEGTAAITTGIKPAPFN